MYEIRVEGQFSATHRVKTPAGDYEPPHHHDWTVEARFQGPTLDQADMLIDFVEVQETLDQVTSLFHERDLNQLEELAPGDPTAEHVACFVFAELEKRLGRRAGLRAVYVTEAPGCVAGFLADS